MFAYTLLKCLQGPIFGLLTNNFHKDVCGFLVQLSKALKQESFQKDETFEIIRGR